MELIHLEKLDILYKLDSGVKGLEIFWSNLINTIGSAIKDTANCS